MHAFLYPDHQPNHRPGRCRRSWSANCTRLDLQSSLLLRQRDGTHLALAIDETGHAVYAEASGTVTRQLQVLALDTLPGSSCTPAGTDALWRDLEVLPWPSPGLPSQQPA